MYIWAFFVFAYVVPLGIIMISYCSIYIFVRRNARAMQSSQSANRQPNQEMKLVKIIGALILLWTATWTPYSVVALLGISGYKDLLSPRVSMIPAIICKACSAFDPYVYTLTHPKFKRELCRKAEEFIHSAITHHSGEIHTPVQLQALGTSAIANPASEGNNRNQYAVQL
jgi:r-opsin